MELDYFVSSLLSNVYYFFLSCLEFLWFVTLDVFNNRTKPRMYVVNRENDNLNVNKGILALEKGNYGQCNKFKAYVNVRTFLSFSLFCLQFNQINSLSLSSTYRTI